MHHFFVQGENITVDEIFITGNDFFHAVNVLRLKKGEKVLISGPDGVDYLCSVSGSVSPDSRANEKEKKLRLMIDEVLDENHEIPARVALFQCLPKSDRMEIIVQKAVELGVSEIIPVSSKNCVVSLDEKRANEKLKRWQAIAVSSAKQSNRSVIPRIMPLMKFKDAVDYLEGFDLRLIPYEQEKSLQGTCEAMISLIPGRSIGVFIGPEGGFDPLEMKYARAHGVLPISLGKRILRTDTAAITTLGIIMIRLEIAAWQDE